MHAAVVRAGLPLARTIGRLALELAQAALDAFERVGEPIGGLAEIGQGHDVGQRQLHRRELACEELGVGLRASGDLAIALGRAAGRRMVCLLTDMNQPLGEAVGNAIELREALATLRGQGPPDFTELVLAASSRLLEVSDLGIDASEGRRRAEQAIADGSAAAAYDRWIAAQGGDPAEDALPTAAVVHEVETEHEGFVQQVSAMKVGVAAKRVPAGTLPAIAAVADCESKPDSCEGGGAATVSLPSEAYPDPAPCGPPAAYCIG